MYNKYLVKANDRFDPEQFPFIADDISMMKDQTEHLSGSFRSEIIIGFMKNHSLENEWKNGNPELTKLVTAGSLSSRNIESLFESCGNNPLFRQQLEDFIRSRFAS